VELNIRLKCYYVVVGSWMMRNIHLMEENCCRETSIYSFQKPPSKRDDGSMVKGVANQMTNIELQVDFYLSGFLFWIYIFYKQIDDYNCIDIFCVSLLLELFWCSWMLPNHHSPVYLLFTHKIMYDETHERYFIPPCHTHFKQLIQCLLHFIAFFYITA